MVVNVIGAGLAGCEASYYLACHGIKVNLYEMKPVKRTPASKSDLFAELVCSNSLRGASIENAVGLLKEEMRQLDSLIMKALLLWNQHSIIQLRLEVHWRLIENYFLSI